MGEKTGIAWTDSTWNPVRGCTKVSAGCKHCYAETFAERWRGVPGHAFEQGFDLRLVPEALELPLRWRRPRRVFVNSMSDLFHEEVPDTFIASVFGVMAVAQRHTFQVLTKRPDRARRLLSLLDREWQARVQAAAARAIGGWSTGPPRDFLSKHAAAALQWPLPNVWLGVSVEDQRAADERIPELLATPAAVRFLSCEPLLDEVRLPMRALGGKDCIDWLIVGGESGPGARPCWVPDVRSLVVRQCARAGIPVFVKQLGANVQDRNDAGWEGNEPEEWPEHLVQEDRVEHLEEGYQGAPVRVSLRDRAGRDPAEWPADLRVQQFPEVTPWRAEKIEKCADILLDAFKRRRAGSPLGYEMECAIEEGMAAALATNEEPKAACCQESDDVGLCTCTCPRCAPVESTTDGAARCPPRPDPAPGRPPLPPAREIVEGHVPPRKPNGGSR